MLRAAVAFVIGILAIFGSVAQAPAIAIYSAQAGDGFGTLQCWAGPGCTALTDVFDISSPPIPPWQDPAATSQPSAKWVSFNAGHGSFTSGVANGTSTTFRYSFSLGIASYLDLSAWADDTTSLVVDGVSYYAQNPGPYPECATTAIGCKPGTEGVISALLLDIGSHYVDFDFLQAGGNNTPYGMMFAGELTPIPEPATILLLGSALAAAGVVSRRRFKKSEDKA
jgi:hypothetical protein